MVAEALAGGLGHVVEVLGQLEEVEEVEEMEEMEVQVQRGLVLLWRNKVEEQQLTHLELQHFLELPLSFLSIITDVPMQISLFLLLVLVLGILVLGPTLPLRMAADLFQFLIPSLE